MTTILSLVFGISHLVIACDPAALPLGATSSLNAFALNNFSRLIVYNHYKWSVSGSSGAQRGFEEFSFS